MTTRDAKPIAKSTGKPTAESAAHPPASPDHRDKLRSTVNRLDNNRILQILLFLLVGVLMTSMISFHVDGDLFSLNATRATIFGVFVLGTAIFHLFLGHRDLVFFRNRRIVTVFGLILLQLFLARMAHRISETWDVGHAALFAPMALSPIALCVLLGQRMGIFAALYGSLLTALVADPADAYLFIILGLGCGLVGIASTRKVRRRSRLIRAGVYVGITHIALAWTFGVCGPLTPDGSQINWMRVIEHSAVILAVELGIVILLSGILPVLEGAAGVTTDISWIELSDLNHPLLKRLTIEAPGTYHHSLVVATLGEAAADAIGANATMVRVLSHFHDIGKLANPQFFIENQGGGANPHDTLTPAMSARTIINHVRDGLALAKKEKLNPAILAGIREHHGDSLVTFFHRKALELHQKQQEEIARGLRTEEDLSPIHEDDFRYPGPRPASRETAILSLADAVESASRTLSDHSPDAVRVLLDRIFDGRMRDGQLSDAPLTLQELTTIRHAFADTLKNLLHARVPYPAEREDPGGPRPLPVPSPSRQAAGA